MPTKIWLYDDEKRKVFTAQDNDPRLVLGRLNAPAGKCVWFRYREHNTLEEIDAGKRWAIRKSARNKWLYLFYGATEAELCERVNARILSTIDRREARIRLERENIERLRAALLNPSAGKRKEG